MGQGSLTWTVYVWTSCCTGQGHVCPGSVSNWHISVKESLFPWFGSFWWNSQKIIPEDQWILNWLQRIILSIKPLEPEGSEAHEGGLTERGQNPCLETPLWSRCFKWEESNRFPLVFDSDENSVKVLQKQPFKIYGCMWVSYSTVSWRERRPQQRWCNGGILL